MRRVLKYRPGRYQFLLVFNYFESNFRNLILLYRIKTAIADSVILARFSTAINIVVSSSPRSPTESRKIKGKYLLVPSQCLRNKIRSVLVYLFRFSVNSWLQNFDTYILGLFKICSKYLLNQWDFQQSRSRISWLTFRLKCQTLTRRFHGYI